LRDRNFEPDIIGLYEPKTYMEFWALRASQLHDVLEHIVAGAPFDIINEMVPTAMRIASVHRHLSPKLAGKLSIINNVLLTSQLMRTNLHYPECVNAVIERMERGLLIGR